MPQAVDKCIQFSLFMIFLGTALILYISIISNIYKIYLCTLILA